ncbi:LytTR family DNA-binding domain-containing protein [Aquimarina sp. 2201CG5-10]|uniref:LytR/AlgR family response regulator transcription factor n=1 Tax=Aquimarina callyspongiae TaxID=3098150 RepID=UPI002AB4E987|nr:LytTR family DNA-binding domain-containing protein [Aquimarina sp. 2201CG5-10]MDY8135272.1 LytTR family DNA-binding domain-containing protein [Aquimarina sp. 2201CG5-10]
MQPFGSNNFNNPYKNLYFIGYGVISFLTYLIIFLLSKWYHSHFRVWKWGEELIFSFFYISFAIIIAFIYTEIIINKQPERLNLNWFLDWFKLMFLGFGIIVSVIAILLRNYYGSKVIENKKELNISSQETRILIQGSLKKENFLIDANSIVYVKSEDNYVYLYFIEDEILKEKMLRNTLTNISLQLPQLMRSHRSYLINPNFIISIKGNAQNAKLQLKAIEKPIPISKTYFASLKTLIN